MKTTWQIKTLGEVCSFSRGLTYNKSDEVDFSNNAILRANNIDLGRNSINFQDIRYIRNEVNIPNSKLIKKGSLLVCTASGSKSHLGKVALIENNDRFAYGGFMGLILPNQELDPHYLFYRMISYEYKKFIDELTTGININNLRFDQLGKFTIPLPPVLEQRRIVKILDEAFEGISKAKNNVEKNLQNSCELFESHLEAIFSKPKGGWKQYPLGDVAKIVMGQSPKGETYNTVGIGLPLINGPVEFGMGQLATTHITKYTSRPTKTCKKGDLIICVRGSTTGKTNIAGQDSCLGRGVASISSNSLILRQQLLNIYIASLRNKIYKLGTGSTFPNVSGDVLSKILVSFPALEEQGKIIGVLDSLSSETKKLEEIYKKKLVLLDELKKSLLHQAFTGQL